MERAAGTERVLGCTVKTPSTLGTLLRNSVGAGRTSCIGRAASYWRQHGSLAGSLRRAVSHRPGLHPPQADEIHGLVQVGPQRRYYSGQRGYSPLLSMAAGTGLPMSD